VSDYISGQSQTYYAPSNTKFNTTYPIKIRRIGKQIIISSYNGTNSSATLGGSETAAILTLPSWAIPDGVTAATINFIDQNAIGRITANGDGNLYVINDSGKTIPANTRFSFELTYFC
jgi:hypothetical protein